MSVLDDLNNKSQDSIKVSFVQIQLSTNIFLAAWSPLSAFGRSEKPRRVVDFRYVVCKAIVFFGLKLN